MRRSVSILVAAAMVAASAAVGIAPAGAASVRVAPIAVTTSAGIVKADYWRHNRGYRRHYDRRNHVYSRRHRVAPFYFGFQFPFAFTPRYYSYQYQDCFRTRDGRVYCRRY